jgi:NADPH:quinone reductase-like Zn-dependent oxidoreductase
MFQEGRIEPLIDPRAFGFDALPEALAHLQSREAVGKVVVTV